MSNKYEVATRLTERILKGMEEIDEATTARLGEILFGPYDDDVVRLRGVNPKVNTSPETDNVCLALLHSLRTGDYKGFRVAVSELDRLYTYAGAGPTKVGFSILLHVMNMLETHFLVSTSGEGKLPNLVASSENTYDPETQIVLNQENAAKALQELNEGRVDPAEVFLRTRDLVSRLKVICEKKKSTETLKMLQMEVDRMKAALNDTWKW